MVSEDFFKVFPIKVYGNSSSLGGGSQLGPQGLDRIYEGDH